MGVRENSTVATVVPFIDLAVVQRRIHVNILHTEAIYSYNTVCTVHVANERENTRESCSDRTVHTHVLKLRKCTTPNRYTALQYIRVRL